MVGNAGKSQNLNKLRFANNPGNNQLGRQQGHNTEKDSAKSDVKLQTRNDPGAPKTTGPEKKELKEDFKKR